MTFNELIKGDDQLNGARFHTKYEAYSSNIGYRELSAADKTRLAVYVAKRDFNRFALSYLQAQVNRIGPRDQEQQTRFFRAQYYSLLSDISPRDEKVINHLLPNVEGKKERSVIDRWRALQKDAAAGMNALRKEIARLKKTAGLDSCMKMNSDVFDDLDDKTGPETAYVMAEYFSKRYHDYSRQVSDRDFEVSVEYYAHAARYGVEKAEDALSRRSFSLQVEPPQYLAKNGEVAVVHPKPTYAEVEERLQRCISEVRRGDDNDYTDLVKLSRDMDGVSISSAKYDTRYKTKPVRLIRARLSLIDVYETLLQKTTDQTEKKKIVDKLLGPLDDLLDITHVPTDDRIKCASLLLDLHDQFPDWVSEEKAAASLKFCLHRYSKSHYLTDDGFGPKRTRGEKPFKPILERINRVVFSNDETHGAHFARVLAESNMAGVERNRYLWVSIKKGLQFESDERDNYRHGRVFRSGALAMAHERNTLFEEVKTLPLFLVPIVAYLLQKDVDSGESAGYQARLAHVEKLLALFRGETVNVGDLSKLIDEAEQNFNKLGHSHGYWKGMRVLREINDNKASRQTVLNAISGEVKSNEAVNDAGNFLTFLHYLGSKKVYIALLALDGAVELGSSEHAHLLLRMIAYQQTAILDKRYAPREVATQFDRYMQYCRLEHNLLTHQLVTALTELVYTADQDEDGIIATSLANVGADRITKKQFLWLALKQHKNGASGETAIVDELPLALVPIMAYFVAKGEGGELSKGYVERLWHFKSLLDIFQADTLVIDDLRDALQTATKKFTQKGHSHHYHQSLRLLDKMVGECGTDSSQALIGLQSQVKRIDYLTSNTIEQKLKDLQPKATERSVMGNGR